MKKEIKLKDELTEFLLYTAPNGDVKIEAFLHNETIWLNQKRIAAIFGVDVTTINEHLKNIYKTNELDESSTIGNFPIVQQEGKREVKRNIHFYNLDAILSVGYRVNSMQATHFRIWATKTLKEFNKYDILEGKGKISKIEADNKAGKEYAKFNKIQKINSDFERQIKKLKKGNK